MVLLVYGVVSAVGLHYHEIFLDEAHHFLLARDSAGLGELFFNSRYDGHPRLWHVLLFGITHFVTPSVYGMQVFHWIISFGVAFVFLRYAPFSFWVKVLVLSGYYFLFEYSLLSRNYALGILLLFLCCMLLRSRRGEWLVLLGVLLFLMCNTHVFFTFAATGIFLYVLLRWRAVWGKPFLVFCCLYVLGCVCALIQARTPVVDNVNMTPVNARGFLSVEGLSFAAQGLVRGWLPVPAFSASGHFWNTYWVNGGVVRAVLFALLVLFPVVVLWRDKGALLFYYTGVALLLLFFSVTLMTASRYFGMVFIFFLAAVWMRGGLAEVPFFARTFFLFILVVQGVVGVFAWVQEVRLPFSESREVADLLKGQPVVVDGYNAGPMLSAYMGRPVFYLATCAEGSFCVWKKEYFPRPRPSISEYVGRCSLGLPDSFFLVSNRRLEGLTPLKVFDRSVIGENFFVYRYSKR